MYCTKCGRLLQEGEICTCQAATPPQAETESPANPAAQGPAGTAGPETIHYVHQYSAEPQPQQLTPITFEVPPSAPARPNGFAIYLRILRECFKSYFKDSVLTARQAANHRDLKTGFSFAGIACLLTGLFSMALIGSLLHSVLSGISTFASMFFSGRSSGLLSAQVGTPDFLIFLLTFLLSVAVYFGICAIGLIIGGITHKKASYKALLASVGVACLPAALIMVAATIVALFWLSGALFLAMAAFFTWLISTYSAIKETLEITDSRISIYYGLFCAVAIGLCLLIAARFAPDILGRITIAGSKISDMFSSLTTMTQ